MLGYHFTADTLRDGRPIPAQGEWLEYDGPIVPCCTGLHASKHPFDALQYAPGSQLHFVELDGALQSHGDPVNKWVGRRRKILASIDATDMLCEFARWCALQVIDLWDAPYVVRKYLATGDESLMLAARAAAFDAIVPDVAASAAWVSTWDNRHAVHYRRGDDVLARDKAVAASWDAWAATCNAGGDALAARVAQRQRFAEMVDAAFAAIEVTTWIE